MNSGRYRGALSQPRMTRIGVGDDDSAAMGSEEADL
jgi:hypothetical protein